MLEYLDWRGDLSFDQSPLCPIDFLIFATLAYCPMENLKLPFQEETLTSLEARLYPAQPVHENELGRLRCELWHKAALCPRFSGVRLSAFVSHFDAAQEKQFAAALFHTASGADILAYRGTDATLVGWKEDFNLAFESPIPAQRDGVEMLNQSAARKFPLYVCGHSKGGNLALYAAAHCLPTVRQALLGVYSFDGPGLDDATGNSAEYAQLSSRIHSYVPESSIVGMLLDYHDQYTIIDSDGVSIWQHNPFLWHVKGPGFVTKNELTRSGRYTDRTLHDFLAACSPQERRILVDTIFDVINATGATRLREIPGGIARNLSGVLAKLKNVSPENRAVLLKILKALGESGGNHLELLLGREE